VIFQEHDTAHYEGSVCQCVYMSVSKYHFMMYKQRTNYTVSWKHVWYVHLR